MPWIDSYPKARPGGGGVQVDLNPDRLGPLRYPVEVGLVGGRETTLAALLPLFEAPNPRRGFLSEAQARMKRWSALLEKIESTGPRARCGRKWVIRALSDLLAEDAGRLPRLRRQHSLRRGGTCACRARSAPHRHRDAGRPWAQVCPTRSPGRWLIPDASRSRWVGRRRLRHCLWQSWPPP